MAEKVRELKLGDRDLDETLYFCVQCNRIWGKDDILPIDDAAKPFPEGSANPVGLCPWCKDHRDDFGFVYEAKHTEPKPKQSA
jgi:hypothetical protein